MRTPYLISLISACILFLAACGGGSGSDNSSGTSGPTVTGTSVSSASSGANNVQPVIVDTGPAAAGSTINEAFVSVTICAPASPTNCQTIDHILVDTGSYGLRIIASALSSSLSLPIETNTSGNNIAECTQFADGYTWGPIRLANLQIAGESANNMAVQIIGDSSFSNLVPASCYGSGLAPENTVASFGANGVLGIGAFAQDCGSRCVTTTDNGFYYACSSTTCVESKVTLAQQIQNPVSLFATDNNGVIVSLPALPQYGAATVSGSLIFGVGTQSNNGLGSAQVYTIDSSEGFFTTTYKGTAYTQSFLDSGSNGLFFDDSTIPECSDGSGFYCPTTTLNLSAVNTGTNAKSGTVTFGVGNADNFFTANSSDSAYSLLAGINGDPSSFDWGLPFFYGRNVYTVIEGAITSGGTGPYFAY